ncbi:MOGS [Mytilus coruscus]|uniref:mannosyl-oligosaccharide glucosidase n=1 Tax=Mytilus coruscus TaxID=42192 RepID=A0A6J8E0G6_MYTCO|nr:MOGS [Mytilus coruscus]
MVRNLTNTDLKKKIFPRLKVWLNLINSSQAGNDPYTYYWRSKENKTTQLNPLTPSSGFDDYPRASHHTVDERHVDLRCWIAMSYSVLSDIAKRIHEEWQDYEATYKLLVNNEILDSLHWSPERQMYSDNGFHTYDLKELNNIRFTATEPKLMNYLTLSGLNYYIKTPGKYQRLAETIYKDLRNNIVTNV